MNQKLRAPVLLMAGLGGFALFLRMLEEGMAYDAAGGYYHPWHPMTLLRIAVYLLAALVAVLAPLRLSPEKGDQRDCTMLDRWGVLMVFVSAALVGVGTALFVRGLSTSSFEVPWLERVLAAASALAFLALAALGADTWRKRGGLLSKVSLAILSLFYCLWLLYQYRYHAANPSRNAFLWESLAIALAAVGVSQFMGYFYEAAQGKRCCAVLLYGEFALLAALPDEEKLSLRLLLLASAVLSGLLASCCRAIPPRRPEEEKKDEHQNT